jgi:uncharacterized protein YihD (DUF1040 family)
MKEKNSENVRDQKGTATLKDFNAIIDKLKIEKGEAVIIIAQNKNRKVIATWDGEMADMANDIYTIMKNNTKAAAFICKITKDYLNRLKTDPQKWVELTSEILKFREMPEKNQEEGKVS